MSVIKSVCETKPTLQFGSQGGNVRALQNGLNNHFGQRQQIATDGNFGRVTERAVKIIQYRSFLEQDGIVGPKMWHVLCTGSLFEQPVLRRGSTGALVGRVQQVLKQGQFYQGTPDQEFGPLTEAAVKVFQGDRGLLRDGIIGDETWFALRELANILTATANPNAELVKTP